MRTINFKRVPTRYGEVTHKTIELKRLRGYCRYTKMKCRKLRKLLNLIHQAFRQHQAAKKKGSP